jgi:hypothetical protein
MVDTTIADAQVVHLCAASSCNKPASNKCACYSEGAHVPTFYCSRDCQTKDLPLHKTSCKAAAQCSRLFRAADVMQAVAMAFLERTFPYDLESVSIHDGVIKFTAELSSWDGKGFPSDSAVVEDVKRALLSFCGFNI